VLEVVEHQQQRLVAQKPRYRCRQQFAGLLTHPQCPRDRWEDRFVQHVVLPAVGEVILIEDALTDSKAKVGQVYVSGIVTEADPAIMPDALLTAVDDEAVQVLVAPAEDKL
jgi:hypothetical protein